MDRTTGTPALRKVLIALAALALVGVAAQAALLTVFESEEPVFLRGERFDLGSAFTVEATNISVASGDQEAKGTPTSPVEITSSLPEARTDVPQDHWTYTAELKEASAAAVGSGTFKAILYLTGGEVENEPQGAVYLQQRATERSNVEGATVTWDLGPSLPDSPLFLVRVESAAPGGGGGGGGEPDVEYTLESTYSATDGYQWVGVGGEIDGEINPALEVDTGETVRFTIRHGCEAGDTAPHNFRILDPGGEVVLESEDVDACGDETTEEWTPTSAGEYSYECAYHPTTMNATLTVTEAGAGGQASSPGLPLPPTGPSSRELA